MVIIGKADLLASIKFSPIHLLFPPARPQAPELPHWRHLERLGHRGELEVGHIAQVQLDLGDGWCSAFPYGMILSAAAATR